MSPGSRTPSSRFNGFVLREQNREFSCLVKKLESDPVCQRQTLKSFLVLPFQRITRVKLILEVDFKPHTQTHTHTRQRRELLNKNNRNDSTGVSLSFQNVRKLTEPGSEAIVDLERAIEAIHEVSLPSASRRRRFRGA